MFSLNLKFYMCISKLEPFDASIYELQNAEESKKTTATDLELLQQMYELLLGDLEE